MFNEITEWQLYTESDLVAHFEEKIKPCNGSTYIRALLYGLVQGKITPEQIKGGYAAIQNKDRYLYRVLCSTRLWRMAIQAIAPYNLNEILNKAIASPLTLEQLADFEDGFVNPHGILPSVTDCLTANE